MWGRKTLQGHCGTCRAAGETSCHQPGEPLSLHYGKGPHLSHPTVSERGLLYYEDLTVYMYVPV